MQFIKLKATQEQLCQQANGNSPCFFYFIFFFLLLLLLLKCKQSQSYHICLDIHIFALG